MLDRALEAHRATLDMREELDALHQRLAGHRARGSRSRGAARARPASCSTISTSRTSTRSSPRRAACSRGSASRTGDQDRPLAEFSGGWRMRADARRAAAHRSHAAVPRRADEPSRPARDGMARGLPRGLPRRPGRGVARPRVPRHVATTEMRELDRGRAHRVSRCRSPATSRSARRAASGSRRRTSSSTRRSPSSRASSSASARRTRRPRRRRASAR